ncbi:MAG: hypothetical protein RTU30_01625 [Candidatus Thorarchaeota archaeon]
MNHRSRIVLAFLLVVMLPVFCPVVTENPEIFDAPVISSKDSAQLSSAEHFNMTEFWEEAWSEVSLFNFGNLTQRLSEDYPDRVWNTLSNAPSPRLKAACDWANQTLMNDTADALVFREVTDYGVLYAIQNGTTTNSDSCIVITGVIDSEDTDGANDVAVSVAAVLETARVLSDYSLPFDVYYALSTAGRSNPDNDPAAEAFASWMSEQNMNIITSLSYDRMLFHKGAFPWGTKLVLRNSADGVYQQTDWLTDLMIMNSANHGAGRLTTVPDINTADHSVAWEMWNLGESGIHITQGYYPDPWSGTEDDTWDNIEYNYAKAREGVASAVSAILFLSQARAGIPSAFYINGDISVNQTRSTTALMTYIDYLNVTITWENESILYSDIVRVSDNTTVYSRTESDGKIVMKYRPLEIGEYTIRVSNLGPNGTPFHMNITHINDVDGDSLNDIEEHNRGTNVYSTDSDFDGLSDDLEISIGSNPISADSDQDGASDLDEYTDGSSLLSNDTDSDGLLDGYESELGTSLTDSDSDNDGLDDRAEVEVYLTNPLRRDTDRDGLEDGFEVTQGLNPLSPDSDSDSLSDLFEVLNGLNPLSTDTDNDGWGDAYEVEFCLSPTRADSDYDGILDGIDWDPQVHWVAVVAPVTVISIISLIAVYGFLKFRLYKKQDAAEGK